jgi:hypothetical protein
MGVIYRLVKTSDLSLPEYCYKEALTGECGIVSQVAHDRLPLR